MLDSLYANNMVPVADVGNANMQAIYHNRSLFHYVIEAEKPGMDKIGVAMQQNVAAMHKLLDKYRKTVLTPQEVALLGKFDASWPVYLGHATKVMAFSYEGKNDEAMQLMDGDARTSFKAADDDLSALVDLNVALGQSAHATSNAVVAQSRAITYAVIAFAVLLSVGLGLLISASITRSLVKAGEVAKAVAQGRGFAVVASEVRSLAGRSADAAQEIKLLISASVQRVAQGTLQVDKAGTTMTEVVSSIRRVTDIMGEISAASHEQNAGVAQIGEAIAQIDQATQQNAALVEEMAAAASSMQLRANGLVEAVSVFKLGHSHT